MKAIRRFTVRPVLPEPLQPLSDLARNLRWSWHSETRGLFEAVDPAGWRAADADPVRLLGEVLGDPAGRARRRPALPGQTDCRGGGSRRLSGGSPLVSGAPGAGRRAAGRRRLLLAGVRSHRRPAAVLRRPRHPGRRSSEGRQRSRCTAHRCRAALPARLFPPVAVTGRLAAGAVPGSRPRRAAADPAAGSGRKARPGGPRPAGPADPARRRLAGTGRPGPVADARLRRRGEQPRGARGDRPALWRRQRAPTAAGDAAGHRRGQGGAHLLPAHRASGTRGLAHQRGARRIPRS